MPKNTTMVITAPMDSSGRDRAKAVGPAIPLAAWTLFVWLGRVRNIIVDDDLGGFERGWRLALAVTFIALATVATVSLVRFLGRGRANAYGLIRRSTQALAWFGIVVWPIRAITILLASHDVGFKVVHTILAVVTIGLSAIAVRWVAATR